MADLGGRGLDGQNPPQFWKNNYADKLEPPSALEIIIARLVL